MIIVRKRALTFFVLAIAYVAAHALATLQRAVDPMLLSYLFQIGAPLAAAGIAWTMDGIDQKQPSLRWRLIALAFVLWACGMGLSMFHDLTANTYSPASSYSVVVYVFYGVPLLLVLATPPAEWSSPLIRGIDTAMIALLASLIIFNSVQLDASKAHADPTLLNGFITMLDVENYLLLLFSATRLAAAMDWSGRTMYGALAAYSASYCVVAFYYNHHVVGTLQLPAGTPYDLLIDLPFAIFSCAVLAIGQSTAAPTQSRPRLRRFAAVVPPFFLTITVVIASILVARRSFYVGTACAVLAILGYGIRSTLQELRQIGARRLAERDRDAIADLVWTDSLTGVRNRRAFDAALDLEWHRARKTEHSLALLMIDIDQFKQINDALGHVAGDQVIRRIGETLEATASLANDVLARYGGEEFACLLPDTTMPKARIVAERMRRAVEMLAIAHPGSPHAVVTVSVGVASRVPAAAAATDPSPLVEAADRALYAAKSAGRNRVAS